MKFEVQPYNQFLKHNCGGSKSQCRPRWGGARRRETPSCGFYTRRNSLTHFYHCQKSNAYFKFWSLPTRHQYPILVQLNLYYIRKSLEFIKDMQSGFDPWVIIVSCNTIYNAQVGLARWTFLQRSSCNFCYFTSLFPFVIRFHDTSKWLYTRVSSNSSRLIKNNKTKW